MRTFIQRVRQHWNGTDRLVMVTNHAALAAFVANCWWHSVLVCYAASLAPLVLQFRHARRGAALLLEALWFGALIGFAWPLGEGLVTSTLGWWGAYTAPGPVLWRTPLYCVLIGWLASTHIYYLSRRFAELGYGLSACVAHTGITAFAVGLLGENLFVSAGMWRYDASPWDWWGVPAFVPIAYGLGYGVVPLLGKADAGRAALACGSLLFITCVGLGLLVGFFPR